MGLFKSICDIELLSMTAEGSYLLEKDDLFNTNDEHHYILLKNIAKKGYTFDHAVSPAKTGGTGKSSLASICFQPHDKNKPIVISYRGTSSSDDVLSDLFLGVRGVVQKKFRDDAYTFYNNVRKEYPDREIVLTGHSLGGHLAQYVGTKAYNEDSKLLNNPTLQVRTFNTAPISTKHEEVFVKKPEISNQIVNYRTSSDMVSDLPLQNYYGNTCVFPCKENPLTAHKMATVQKDLPPTIKSQEVGTSNNSAAHNQLHEKINLFLQSYQCRINGQFFSKYRAGRKNLDLMNKHIPQVLECIKNKEYETATSMLNELKGQMSGKVSTNMIDTLSRDTQVLSKAQPNNRVLQDYKNELQSLRSEFTASQESSEDQTSVTKPGYGNK